MKIEDNVNLAVTLYRTKESSVYTIWLTAFPALVAQGGTEDEAKRNLNKALFSILESGRRNPPRVDK